MCVAVDNLGNIVTSIHPTGGTTAWKASAVGHYYLVGVSCPATNLCVAIDDSGDALTSTNPTGGAAAWKLSKVDPGGGGLSGISCPSVNLCVAVDWTGQVVVAMAHQV
jgi:hypothetical protein